ncbi:DUF4390 domain-containing protein [Solemya velum gill symbiont]|uniref:DUF4390 domain-containing protein n=1 Tax=Solemya velum gill symbiont TaxID=2340 RepID=A0A0B0H609_SOVGS|nr:DUF4390 domain-containing protein [Solemya velum gill symbiont]KHF24102.1 hypothetical protein JV46_29000 [Solemya velum gill symbiont]OOY36142.1 hypothetical protein BOV88_00655 [Solemya velum gill symbiont]OOY38152.1 hypothetical protein BOV89_03425 [Solemya velum gill symbiont]OOY39126.1 hypothetical protein BOV90_10960 [Solemya velum gill symbiont]OOY44168.1 hypothetical protein BOV91_02100 [Solemya velum gill symbiont]
MRLLTPLLCLFIAGCFNASDSKGIEITAVHSWNQGDGGYLTDLDISYTLSDVVIEALDQGVPLVFIMKIDIRDRQASWFDRGKQVKRIFRARYRPLSNIYEVETFASSSAGSTNGLERFVTKHALFGYLGRIREIPVAGSSELLPGHDYVIAANINLDIESLPLPMRPRAYLSSQWQQQSGWSEWSLNQ